MKMINFENETFMMDIAKISEWDKATLEQKLSVCHEYTAKVDEWIAAGVIYPTYIGDSYRWADKVKREIDREMLAKGFRRETLIDKRLRKMWEGIIK